MTILETVLVMLILALCVLIILITRSIGDLIKKVNNCYLAVKNLDQKVAATNRLVADSDDTITDAVYDLETYIKTDLAAQIVVTRSRMDECVEKFDYTRDHVNRIALQADNELSKVKKLLPKHMKEPNDK